MYELGVHFPCDGCNFNQPLFGDPCCSYPVDGASACPFVTDEDKSILAEYNSDKSRIKADDLTDQLIPAMREFDSGNAKKGRDVVVIKKGGT